MNGVSFLLTGSARHRLLVHSVTVKEAPVAGTIPASGRRIVLVLITSAAALFFAVVAVLTVHEAIRQRYDYWNFDELPVTAFAVLALLAVGAGTASVLLARKHPLGRVLAEVGAFGAIGLAIEMTVLAIAISPGRHGANVLLLIPAVVVGLLGAGTAAAL